MIGLSGVVGVLFGESQGSLFVRLKLGSLVGSLVSFGSIGFVGILDGSSHLKAFKGNFFDRGTDFDFKGSLFFLVSLRGDQDLGRLAFFADSLNKDLAFGLNDFSDLSVFGFVSNLVADFAGLGYFNLNFLFLAFFEDQLAPVCDKCSVGTQ